MAERIRGVNLSGWFIPEPWVTPSLFAATGASNASELQAALGATAYNERIRQHLETFITEADFRRIAAIGLNAVRLPVPCTRAPADTRKTYATRRGKTLPWVTPPRVGRDNPPGSAAPQRFARPRL